MYATAVRSFKTSAVRMSAEAGKSGGAVQWFGYFFGITAFVAGGAAILYKANEDNSIRNNFIKNGVNQKKPVLAEN